MRIRPYIRAAHEFVEKTKYRHPDMLLAVAATIAVIVAAFGLSWANSKVVTPAAFPGFHYILEPHNPLSFMANWDAGDYIFIATHGYTNGFMVNWLPLYPITIWAAHLIIPSPLLSALSVSWLCLVGAAYFFIKVVRQLFEVTERSEPARALIFFLLFPTAVFLTTAFSESLYAFVALGAMYFALAQKWRAAALLLALCTATHITGPLVVLLVALILAEQHVPLRKVAATAAIGSLGLAGYMVYLQVRFHRPLGFIQSQQTYHGWGQGDYAALLGRVGVSNVLIIALLVLAAMYWWKRRKSFAVYSLLFLLIPAVGRQFGGFDRYALMAFPVQFMLYAYFRERKSYPLLTALLGMVWAYFVLQYAGGYIGS